MMDYGFGYDPEVPGGFQDADLEMREFEDRAAEQREKENKDDGWGGRHDCSRNYGAF